MVMLHVEMVEHYTSFRPFLDQKEKVKKHDLALIFLF